MVTMEWTEAKLNSLNYNDIRKLAKEHNIKAVGKKSVLVDQLWPLLQNNRHKSTKNYVDSDGIPILSDEDVMQVDDEDLNLLPKIKSSSSALDQKQVMSSTVISEDLTDISTDDNFLINDNDAILAGNLGDVTRTLTPLDLDLTRDLTSDSARTLSEHKENQLNATTTVENEVVQKNSAIVTTTVREKINKVNPPRSNLPRVVANTTAKRYAQAHQKMFAKMESIDDAANRLKKRHQQLLGNFSNFTNRLANPKTPLSSDRYRFTSPKSPNPEMFKFSDIPTEQIASVQKPFIARESRSARPARLTTRRPRVDVKTLTRSAPKLPARKHIPITIPNCSERIDELSTPKSVGAVKISKERRSYTPKLTPYKYVDTTKMSDAEFQMHKRLERQKEF